MTSDSPNSPDFSSLPPIRSPKDVKALSPKQLPLLAAKVRHDLIECLSKTGGHLGPNLGVVELTIAMHRVFDSPKDKFVFDVSHQGYVHKMLTGRWEQLGSIRTYQGLNGFLLRTESEHDCYGAGHAGTALSAALGMAVARDIAQGDENIVCVAGDAAFTCGPTFEAMNNVATTKRFIVVLNDNEWSIDKNVGAIARYFNKIGTSSTYRQIHETAATVVERIAGKGVRALAHKIEESAKHLIMPSVLFEEFGFRYYGPIDGHDINQLVKTFEFLKTQQEPVLLHIITTKGRGYEPAMVNQEKFHGLGPYKTETGETEATSTPTFSQVFAKSLVKFAKTDPTICAITAAMPSGTGLGLFKQEIPDRYFDVGIAEEHAALFACGLATRKLKPFLAIYSTFMQRAYDMIIHDIALQNLPVRLCMDRGGLSGDDGPTHHGLFDIGYLRHIPGIIHMSPKDEEEFADMLWTMTNYNDGPTAIRYPRGTGTGATPKEVPTLLKIGEAEVVQDGTDIALIGLGQMFEMAAAVRDQLVALGYRVALINPRWIKPLDARTFLHYGQQCRVLCTFEDHVLMNGFGASIIELLHTHGCTTPVERIGWPDAFVEHGKPDILRQKHGVTAENALAKVLAHFPKAPTTTASPKTASELVGA